MSSVHRSDGPAAPKPAQRLRFVFGLLYLLALCQRAARAQQDFDLLYETDFADEAAPGWSLASSQEGQWVVDGGTLNGFGHVWAALEERSWGEEGAYTYRVRLRSLQGGINANFQLSGAGRYTLGLNNSDGQLRIELFKEHPTGTYTQLVQPRNTDYFLEKQPDGFWIEIRTDGPRIEVHLEEYEENPALTHMEANPLPPGLLAFETYEESAAQIDAVEIWGRLDSQRLPDLAIADAAWRFEEDRNAVVLDLRATNLGNGEAGSSDIRVQLLPTEYGITDPIPALAPGQSVERAMALDLPQQLRGEEIAVFINLDPDQRVEESNEENNVIEIWGRVDRPEATAMRRVPVTPTPDRDEGTGPNVPLLILVGVVALVLVGIVYWVTRPRIKGPKLEGRSEDTVPAGIPPPPVRLIRIWLTEGPTGSGGLTSDSQALRAGALYTLHLQVQQRGDATAAASSPNSGVLARLRVVLFAQETDFDFAKEVITLALPEQGDSSQIGYPVRAGRPGRRRLRVCIYYGNVLLQSALLEADVQEGGAPAQSVAAISRVVDYVASPGLDQLDDLTQPTVTIFTNRDSRGTHWIGLFADGDRAPESLRKGLVHEFSAEELTRMARQLRSCLAEIQGQSEYRYAGAGNVVNQHQLDQLNQDLVKLAKLGHGLYNALLVGRLDAAERADALLEFDAFLQEPGDICVARCHAGATSIPWAALYRLPVDSNADLHLCEAFRQQLVLGNDLLDQPRACRAQDTCPLASDSACATICPFGFWGFLHQVGQPLQQVSPTSVDEVPPELASEAYRQSSHIVHDPADGLKMAIAYYPNLRGMAQHLIRLQALARGRQVQLRVEDDRNEIVGSVLRYGGFHLGYFYCHGREQDGLVQLEVGPSDDPGTIQASDLYARWRWNWHGKPHPLIILNACESVAMVPERIGELMLQLRFLGSSGVVGTEIKVWTYLAAGVGEQLIQSILDGRSLGEAFLDLRLQLLRRRNPLGLAYTYYAPSTLHLHTPTDCAWCRTHVRGGIATTPV